MEESLHKILFLDFDGVLNNTTLWFEHAAKQVDQSDPSNNLSSTIVTRLNKIIESTNCHIVVSSAWRWDYTLEQLQGFLSKKGFKYPKRVIDVTKDISAPNREVEVSEWLFRHPHIKAYAVIDDIDFLFNEIHGDHFVQTENRHGMTEENVTKIIEILNKNYEVRQDIR